MIKLYFFSGYRKLDNFFSNIFHVINGKQELHTE